MQPYGWPPSEKFTQKLMNSLQSWGYRAPWGLHTEPYNVWIGEVMSQQTTLEAVLPYYERFIKVLPNVAALAQATREQLAELWRGLGYPSRVYRLQEAAHQIITQGGFPCCYEEWIKLPGVGPYTAAAISSICFNEPKGALDGHAIRVLTRLRAEPVQWWTSRGRNKLQQALDEWISQVPPGQAGLFNQAIMILGSTICKSKNPKCHLCPLQAVCVARQKNQPHKFPLQQPRKKEIHLLVTAKCYLQQNGNILVTKLSPQSPILKNQWSLPLTFKKLTQKPNPKSFQFAHSITHHRLYVTAKSIKQFDPSKKQDQTNSQDEIQFLHPEELLKLSPFSFTEKLVRCLPTPPINHNS
jgi:A/G-specific adenine glycosylase